MDRKAILDVAQQALHLEAQAILNASNRLDENFIRAIQLLSDHSGKIIFTGLGKSGHIAQKLAATFTSIGVPSFFMHPSEAVHGDLGVYSTGDPTIMLSKSGATVELVRLVPILRELGSPIIGILGNMNSILAQQVDIVLDASVDNEADPLNLAPTASTAVALAVGDALASAIMVVKGLKAQDFARFHPGGQLGRNLWLHVQDVMHPLEKVACVEPQTSIKQVVIEMTRFPLGAACVLNVNRGLVGIITDGDIRRAFQKYDDIRALQAQDVMTENPVTIGVDATLSVAVERMEKRKSQISVLPVVDSEGVCLGLIRIHDIYQAGLK